MSCPHADVRYCANEGGAVACFDCGRLFGHLQADDDTFVAYNPTPGHCERHDLPLLAGHYCAMCRLAEMDSPREPARFAEMDRAEAHRSGPRAPFVGGPEST